jgi:hypothetical protein
VVLTWNNPSAIEKAVLNETLISDAMGKMLAAGISWSTTYPLATYNMEFTRSYTDYASYSMNSSATKKRGVVYRANAGIWESGSKNYNMIGFLYSKEIMSYVIKGTKEATLHTSYLADSMLIDLIGASKIADYDMTGYASKIVKRGYSADGIVEAS